ncbi:MAG: nuclear transport factor 2 family protein [Actinomycetota bacterium]|jgi:steroid delta-isomerase|nr:nuclear transport factor 2 family protein [Actinomycetota bacterium]
MPTPESLRRLVERYCDAVTSRDVAAIVALFTENAVQADPANTPPNVGHEAIGAFFQRAVDASSATTFRALAVHTCGHQAAVHFQVTVTLDGGQMVISGIEVFTVTDDERISAVTAYWDDADVTFSAA